MEVLQNGWVTEKCACREGKVKGVEAKFLPSSGRGKEEIVYPASRGSLDAKSGVLEDQTTLTRWGK